MTLNQLSKLLKSTGLPVAYRCWPVGHAPPLPFLCYRFTRSNNFAADGAVYHSALRVRIELLTERKSPDIEAKVESALASLFWEKEEVYNDSEKCYLILYEMEM